MENDFKRLLLDRMRRHGNDPDLARAFIEGMQALFGRQGVVETPLLLLRVEDIFVNYALAIRAEQALDDALAAQAAAGAGEPSKPIAPGFEESIGKARERLRKSMKELEESCAKAGTPIDIGLADVMKPILRKAEGVLDSALRAKPRKRREIPAKTPATK
ncbi:MAG TPA: hypothetical protein PKO36_00505 [Candidatus Hydrogenedentes bacterium]|nr:hypothetical protein [Candidatus Hydrogenedentota bacterium]HOV74191.1 hypothetical protein [Candidatus Hydrogenedentota bacterium]HPC15730.1 hypothetical protein [Candidatus Hydrogenedentota bacterium]HRT19646.1 hypothetical protein [Candidatus Hydrogenedentota bacterium]HRT64420.1 hypothetical protein [Candidatus Hydrogenedentota bacterium]